MMEDDEGDSADFDRAAVGCWLFPRLQTSSLTSSQPTHLTRVLACTLVFLNCSDRVCVWERESSMSAYTLNKPMKIHKDLATPTH